MQQAWVSQRQLEKMSGGQRKRENEWEPYTQRWKRSMQGAAASQDVTLPFKVPWMSRVSAAQLSSVPFLPYTRFQVSNLL
jgi:hypothetical protein